jgi:hypothetical protein
MDMLASTRELLLRKLQNQIAVERAQGEFRAARPVAVWSRDSLVLALPVEGLTNKLMPLSQELGRHPRLIVPGERVRRSREWNPAAAAISVESATLETIKWLTGLRSTRSPRCITRGMPVKRTRVVATLAGIALIAGAALVSGHSRQG